MHSTQVFQWTCSVKWGCCPAIGSRYIVAVKQLQHAVAAQQLAVTILLLWSNFNMPLLPSNWQSPHCCCSATSTCHCCPAIGSREVVAVKQLQDAVAAQQLAVTTLLLWSNFKGCCCPAIGSREVVAVKQLQMPLLSSNWQSPYSCCEATSKAVAAQQLAGVRLLLSSNFKCRCCPAIGSHHIVAVKQLQHAVVA